MIGMLIMGLRVSLKEALPKGLYGRSLMIFITPMVVLQGVVAFVFMERHWDLVTQRLSEAVARNIAAIIEIYEEYPHPNDYSMLTQIADQQLGLTVSFIPGEDLPPAGPKPFFTLLDRALSRQITTHVGRPYWIDTVGRSNLVEIRIKLDHAVMRVLARRSQTYASNSHIFIVWMVGTSLVLIAVALLFLRNQIRPIQRLAEAADSFGKGREVPDFRPRGAREVRQAAAAFLVMRERIERQIETRTTMLAGVSHDLRTILTRFKLQLALLGDKPEIEDLVRDVDEMQQMLEAYLAFARGDQAEQASAGDIRPLLEEIGANAEKQGRHVELSVSGNMYLNLKMGAFKRCIANLVDNAVKFADMISIKVKRDGAWLTVVVEDDGPGIPKAERETVFRPFYRLDDARNQDLGGTGLGLAIARDIARTHGGDIVLSDSKLGGLRAKLVIPV
ncbi:MAG: ATP-binding protein [Hyphomicrobiales bacterium]|nr:ATP-binding protein [Hyphomicrobiales bacterium]